MRTTVDDAPSKRGAEVRFKTYRMKMNPRPNLDKALELAAALEDDEIARKLLLRK